MDTNTELRAASAGNLTADATLTDFPLLPMTRPLYLHIIVPSVSSGDTLVPIAYFDDVSNNHLANSRLPAITAAGKYTLPLFCDKQDMTDLSVVLDCTADSTAAMNFGAVVVYISTSPLS